MTHDVETSHEDFLQHFTREPPLDIWTCISETEIATDAGRVTVLPGQQFMPGTEIAHRLDEEARHQSAPVAPVR
jgi:hypothetical protein